MIGIGGIGMSGIAMLLQQNGYLVCGSDASSSDTVQQLKDLGITVFLGHQAAHVQGADLVVYSSAVSATNPELLAAKEQQIPVIPRAEMLAELMRLKYGVAVAGAHGKTTTTSIISMALMEGHLDPTIVVGGRMDNFGGTNARLGRGEFMVVEADESDGSFNKLSPSIAVVTNIDREHMEYYGHMRKLRQAYLSFLNKVPFYGLCVFWGEDPNLKLIRPRITRRIKTYGFSGKQDYKILNYETQAQGSRFLVQVEKETFPIELSIPGKHNALNSVAALIVADELSIPRELSLKGICSYRGVQRRFHRRGELRGVLFIDDYAHHPTEIRATLQTARELFPKSNLRVLFQPHRFSRTRDLFDEFSVCFHCSDEVTLLPIYAASEVPIPGIESALLADNINRQGVVRAAVANNALQAIQEILGRSKPGDVILTLGAGDLPGVYRELF